MREKLSVGNARENAGIDLVLGDRENRQPLRDGGPAAADPSQHRSTCTCGAKSRSEGGDTRDGLAAWQKAAETKAARAASTGFRVGDQARTNSPRSPRFHNRTGRVARTNLGEVGLTFTANDNVDAWFLPAELTKVRGHVAHGVGSGR